MKKVFFEHLSELARSDDRIFLLVGDIGFGAVEGFAKEFPNRFLNVGVAEQNMASIAAGLAKKGFRPFTYSIANFPLLRAYEQVRNDIVHENLPVTIVSVGTGFDYGNLGYSHHAIDDVAPALALSGLRVYCPMDSTELSLTLRETVSESAPAYIKITKDVPDYQIDGQSISDLSPRVIWSTGNPRVGIASYGRTLVESIGAARILQDEHSMDSKVISIPRLDSMELDFAHGLEFLFLVEEQTQRSGLSGALSHDLLELRSGVRYRHIGIDNAHMRSNGTSTQIREIHALDERGICARIRTVIRDSI